MIILTIVHVLDGTQEGDNEHINSGIAVVISTAGENQKRMYVGIQNEGMKYIDAIGNCEEEVIINSEGCGNFRVNRKKCICLDKKIKNYKITGRKHEKNKVSRQNITNLHKRRRNF